MRTTASEVRQGNLVCVEDDEGQVWQFSVAHVSEHPETGMITLWYSGTNQKIEMKPDEPVYISHRGW